MALIVDEDLKAKVGASSGGKHVLAMTSCKWKFIELPKIRQSAIQKFSALHGFSTLSMYLGQRTNDKKCISIKRCVASAHVFHN